MFIAWGVFSDLAPLGATSDLVDVAPNGAWEIDAIASYKHVAPLGLEFPNTS